jgi:predicted enzyme related to lactoylglutathione lyase
MKKLCILFVYLLSFAILPAQTPNCQLVGIKIQVPDLAKAKAFYCGILNFGIEKEDSIAKLMWLKTNRYKVILAEAAEAIIVSDKGYGYTSLSMQVNHLDSSIAYLKSKGVSFIKEEKRVEGIGYSVHILDPFGNALSLDQLTQAKKRVQEPALYNCGIYVSDIDQALPTYQTLGFVEGTRNYMPDDMPLVYADKKFGFMLHRVRADMPVAVNPNMRLVFKLASSESLDNLRQVLNLKPYKSGYLLTDATGVKTEIYLSSL